MLTFEIFSLDDNYLVADLIPTLAGTITSSTNQGLYLVDLLESVLHLYMHGCTYPQCLYDQLDS